MQHRTTVEEESRWASVFCSLGLALILCGQQIAWAVRGYMGLGHNVVFPAIPVILGMVLLVRSRWLFRAELQVSPILLAIPILLFFFPVVALSLIEPAELKEQLAYNAMLIFVTIFVALNKNESFNDLPFIVMLVGMVGCALAVVELATSPLEYAVRLGTAGNENPLATALNGAITACAALVVGVTSDKNRWWLGMLAALALGLGLSNVALSVTRSEILGMLGSIAFFIVYLRHRVERRRVESSGGRQRLLAFGGTVVVIGILVPILVSAIFDPRFIVAMLDYASSHIWSLSGAFARNGNVQDPSLAIHQYSMEYNWQHLDPFGHGMMEMSRRFGDGAYAHFDYLQAIYDFGLVGGLLFALVAAVFPVALIVLRLAQGPITPTQALLILLFFGEQIDMMSHGTPYSWTQWPAIMLIYILFMPRSPPAPIAQVQLE